MAVYIASNENRFYGAVEQDYGTVPAITAANRFPAVSLGAKEQLEKLQRRDKTGSRTFTGTPTGVRRKTTFEVKTYLTSWTNQTQEPSCGPLFQSALGSTPRVFGGGTVASLVGLNGIEFVAPQKPAAKNQGGAE